MGETGGRERAEVVLGREARRTQERIEWIQSYRCYLESSWWLEKKRKVMERCGWVCEGCGNRRAIEVHHLRYPGWPVMPGSEEWKRVEKLYDLVGLCEQCHREVHGIESQSGNLHHHLASGDEREALASDVRVDELRSVKLPRSGQRSRTDREVSE